MKIFLKITKNYIHSFLILFLSIIFIGCAGLGTMLDSFEWPTEKPEEIDLVGEWLVQDKSIDFAIQEYNLDFSNSRIILKDNKSFELHNFINCNFEIECQTLNLKGTWEITNKYHDHYYIELKYEDYQSIQVYIWNLQAPYKLWVALGDIDSGHYIFYEKI